LPALAKLKTAVFANVFGYQTADYVEVVRVLEDHEGLAGYELNVSCPNTERGGMLFGSDARTLGDLTRVCRKATRLPLWVKLSPNVTDVRDTAKAAEAEGADALTLVNTFVGMAIDVERRRPVLANVSGGLSGPAIRPLAVFLTWQVARSVKIPVVGMGGIMTARDALEFLVAGATAVQVGTASFVKPSSSADLVQELSAWLEARGIASVREIVGSLKIET